jgi:hypothetical protein
LYTKIRNKTYINANKIIEIQKNIRQWTHRANPATYNAAMTAASNEAANQSILAHEAGKGTCFGCGSYDHQVAACPLTRPDQHCNNSKPRGRGRPRGGRGGCGRGGGSRDTGLGGVGFKQTYLQTRGREGTRGAPLRRGFGNKSNRNGGVNGIGGEDEQYEEYYNKLDTLRNGGVNGIGGEDEQYEEYYNKLDTLELDTLSLNKANGKLDQENWEENDGDNATDNNLKNYMEARNAAAANGDQVAACRWGNDWNEAEDEEFNQINQDSKL